VGQKVIAPESKTHLVYRSRGQQNLKKRREKGARKPATTQKRGTSQEVKFRRPRRGHMRDSGRTVIRGTVSETGSPSHLKAPGGTKKKNKTIQS